MKHLFSLFAAACCALAMTATTYNGTLKVTINGTGTEQDSVAIAIDQNEDGTYKLSLDNFCMENGGNVIGVGNIVIESVAGVQLKDYTFITCNDSITITEGNLPDVNPWLGPMLGEVPLQMTAAFTATELVVSINIDMTSTLGQFINVAFVDPADAASAGKKGDVNGDGQVTIADANSVIGIILNGEQ